MLGSSPANINFSVPKNILKEYLSEDFNLDFLNRKKWALFLMLKAGYIIITNLLRIHLARRIL